MWGALAPPRPPKSACASPQACASVRGSSVRSGACSVGGCGQPRASNQLLGYAPPPGGWARAGSLQGARESDRVGRWRAPGDRLDRWRVPDLAGELVDGAVGHLDVDGGAVAG